MADIVKELTVAAAPKRVWSALTQPDEIGHWWTNDLNATSEVGSLAEFRFGEWGDFVLRFEVAELDEGSKVHWIHRFSPVVQWAGTSVTWQLEPVQNGTKLLFTHDGFAQIDEVYDRTCRNWEYFLASLKSYLEMGKGTPGAPPAQRSASCWQERETLWYLGGLRIIQALETQTKPLGSIFEYLESAGTSTFSYAPYQEDTAFYLIEGEASFVSGETTIHATPGTFLFLPRPVGFHYVVTPSGPARILTWRTPLGFAQQVTCMGSAGQAFVLSPPPDCESEQVQQLADLLRSLSTHD